MSLRKDSLIQKYLKGVLELEWIIKYQKNLVYMLLVAGLWLTEYHLVLRVFIVCLIYVILYSFLLLGDYKYIF